MNSLHGAIVVTSGKGGVGKSESAVNIAAGLKAIGVPPDAIIDLDYGASVTRRFGYQPSQPYAEALLDGKITFEQAIQETNEGLGLIPTHVGISETPKTKLQAWAERIRELARTKLLVIDTSDDIMSAPVAAAILGADILLVPTTLNKVTYVRTFPEIAGLLSASGHLPEIMWFATLVDRRTQYASQLEQRIAGDGVEILAKIPRGVAAAESDLKNLSVVAYAKSSPVAKAYIDLAKLVYARLQRVRGATAGEQGRVLPALPV